MVKTSPEELASQQARFGAFDTPNNNISCFIPPISIKYTQSAAMLAQLSYYGVNVRRNFVILNLTQTDLDVDVYKWRAMVIAGSVLIGVGALIGTLVFLWWFLFLQYEDEEKPKKQPERDFRKSWDARRPQ